MIAEVLASSITEPVIYVTPGLRPYGSRLRPSAAAESRIPAATGLRRGVYAVLQRSAFSCGAPGRGDRFAHRKELRGHARPSVRTCVSAEPFQSDPQLRSRVTADARRPSGAAYMHGHQTYRQMPMSPMSHLRRNVLPHLRAPRPPH